MIGRGWWNARRSQDDELADEIRAHLDEKTDALIAAGMQPGDARQAARRAFGNVGHVQETSRGVWHWTLLESVVQDIRFALRLIRRHPGFSTNVILVTALGIAACATTFSLVSGILLSPLPFSNPERVFAFALRTGDGEMTAAMPLEGYLRIAAGSPIVEAIAAQSPASSTVELNGEPERWDTEHITASYFRTFGVQPLIGRGFTEEEAEHAHPVAVLGFENWRRRFGSDSSIVGKSIVLSNVAHTIVGVMPPRFRAHLNDDPDVWTPTRVVISPDARPAVNAVVRLADGVTAAQAETWMAGVIRWAAASRTTRGDSLPATPALVPIASMIYGEAERPLSVLLGAVLLVVVLVSANVATMFLARASARDEELGLRRAIGASVARQVRQLSTESITLTLIGGVAGIAISYWAVGAVRSLGIAVLPRMDSVALDWRVALFALGATMFMGIAGGLVPGLSARRDTRPHAAGGRITGTRTSSSLVVAQIALSVVLLVGAGLLVKSFLRVVPSSPGFETENRAAIVVSLSGRAEFADSARRRTFVSEVASHMRSANGVVDVAAMSYVPFFGSVSRYDVELPGYAEPSRPHRVYQNIVTENLLDVMGIPLRRGRGFNASDVAGSAPVAIVNETAASRWWPGEDPIGKTMVLPERQRLTLTVVGVMGDTRNFAQDTRIRPELFVPVAQDTPGLVSFIVETRGDPQHVLYTLKRAVWRVAPGLHVGTADDLESIVMDSVKRPRFFAAAMGMFAIAAVLLSGIGIYGLLSFAVTQRRREIGIRMALGATPRQVGGVVIRRAAILGTIGVACGIAAASALSKYLDSLLYEVSTTDLSTFVYAGAAVVAIALIAACAPAWQAVRVDPARSLMS